MKIFFLVFAFFIAIEQIRAVDPLSIRVEQARLGERVKVQIQNNSDHPLLIWNRGSWAWGNWTFEFFNGNHLTVFVRRPDEGFTVNFPGGSKIPALGSIEMSFNLKDSSWISHEIPIFPAYPSLEDKRNAVAGCIALLSISNSPEVKKFGAWIGTITSPFFKL